MQPPDPFDGNGDFEDWARRLISYLSLSNARPREIALNYTTNYTRPLTPKEFTSAYDDDLDEPHRQANYLGTTLFNLPMSLTNAQRTL